MSGAEAVRETMERLNIFAIDCSDDVIIVTPGGNLGEFVVSLVEQDAETTLTTFQEKHDCRHVIIDFCHTDYFGSSALGLFVRLWKRVRERGGRMALCNLSEHEIEVLKITRLNEFWPICKTLGEAKAIVQKTDGTQRQG